MNLQQYQHWLVEYYKLRQWYGYNPFIRLNFLTEEVGELAQAVRAYEIGRDRPDESAQSQVQKLQHIEEELGDVLNNLLILADKYELNLTDILQANQQKILNRFKDEK
ncbi:MazG nucleotide pyrophosphohydrolase domain-containing protein [Rodentibacter pneumotropicus]|uniref:MazG nucleotide pyrophosphohydrolase domain-containing protein n=1 Tax=Rodentibacter pneumotropicus TaxID=758 RepID=UPI000984C4F1|nr:MazG-like family protein [Rodentibacter pneumotropicus]OOF63075.1 hypothetical protein BKL50_04135 [Rodentibacter pneumotropicus]THA19441.1 hypothetical protein D3M83_00145 [Rodentibacter pneumotropicus]